MAYATTAQFKEHFSNKTDSLNDTAIGQILKAVEIKINRFCNRSLDGFLADTTASARNFVGDGGAIQWIDECVQITAVAVKTSTNESSYSSWNSTDWQAATGHPERPNFNKTPYTFITILDTGSQTAFTSGHLGRYSVPTVQVTARWGYADDDATNADVLDLVREATIAQSMRWYERFKIGFHDAVAGAEFSQKLYRQMLDPDIKDMLVNGKLIRHSMAESII